MLTVISLVSLFSQFAGQEGFAAKHGNIVRENSEKRSERHHGQSDCFANFAFFVFRRHRTILSFVLHARICAGSGGAPSRLNPSGRCTGLDCLRRASGSVSPRAKDEDASGRGSEQRFSCRKNRKAGEIRPQQSALFCLLASGVISESQPTYRGHKLALVPPHGWRVAAAPSNPAKAERQVTP
jgi:hypothetical protein